MKSLKQINNLFVETSYSECFLMLELSTKLFSNIRATSKKVARSPSGFAKAHFPCISERRPRLGLRFHSVQWESFWHDQIKFHFVTNSFFGFRRRN
jgi:hypothetical protein